MLEAAARAEHVVTDRVFSAAQRGLLSFDAEYAQPLRAKSYVAVLLGSGSAQAQAMSFSRAWVSGFRAEELELLRRLRPTLSLLMRLFPAGEPAPDARDRARASLLPLTQREAEIAGYVARGLRNAEIALLCGCSPYTVRNQLVAIFRKLGVSTRAELAMFVHTSAER
jgi:DNA-binding CsgD family transcriptional regulator